MLCAKDIMKKAKLILYLLAKKLNRITYEAAKGNSLSVSTLMFYSSLKEILVALKKYPNCGLQAKASICRIYTLNLELISIIIF